MKKETIIELEEMDWKNTEKLSIEAIRAALLSLELNYDILEKAQLRLSQIFDCLPKDEQDRRKRLNVPKTTIPEEPHCDEIGC